MIYLDYAATTPINTEVLEVYSEVSTKYFGNTSSLHDIGSQADYLLTIARQQIAKLINGNEAGVYFTSGGTEANELAVLSLVNGNKSKGRHLITTEVEHSSVYNVFRYLETRGYDVTYLPIDELGKVNLNELKTAINSETILASIHHGNAEIGATQDIHEIGGILAEADVLYHADCVQTFGKISVDIQDSKIDSLSISSHKVYGPKGVGVCYINPYVNWEREMKGIAHEAGFRAGTVDVPGVMAFAHAAKLVVKKMEKRHEKFSLYRNRLLNALEAEGLSVNVIGSIDSELPSIIALTFERAQGQYVMLEYNRYSIAVSTGSACQVGQQNPSRSMLSMGKSVDEAKQLVRISLGSITTSEEIDQLIEATRRIVANL